MGPEKRHFPFQRFTISLAAFPEVPYALCPHSFRPDGRMQKALSSLTVPFPHWLRSNPEGLPIQGEETTDWCGWLKKKVSDSQGPMYKAWGKDCHSSSKLPTFFSSLWICLHGRCML